MKVERSKQEDKFSPLVIILEKSLEVACFMLVLENFLDWVKGYKPHLPAVEDMIYLKDSNELIKNIQKKIYKIYEDPNIEKFWESSFATVSGEYK